MGMFSWECRACGYSLRNCKQCSEEGWQADAVVMFDGVVVKRKPTFGIYDGYGRAGNWNYQELSGVNPCVYHRACWELLDQPGYDRPSRYAFDQGFCLDDDHASPIPKPTRAWLREVQIPRAISALVTDAARWARRRARAQEHTEFHEAVDGLRQLLTDEGDATLVDQHRLATMNDLRDRVERLEAGLETIAAKDGGECRFADWYPSDGDTDDPRDHCSCERCTAKRALRQMPSGYDWRYRGVMHQRILTNPREARIIRAWAHRVGDEALAGILFGGDRASYPTARDWYVATSVVQWLATNVGMSVLEAAGFKYTQWDEDRVRERTCTVSTALAQPDNPKHPEKF